MEAQFDAMEARLEEMQEAAAQPEIIADVPRWQRILQEIKRLTPAVTAYREYKALLSQLAQAREMLSDADFAAVAQEELNALAPQAVDELSQVRAVDAKHLLQLRTAHAVLSSDAGVLEVCS